MHLLSHYKYMNSKHWSNISDKYSILGQDMLSIGLPKMFTGIFRKMLWKTPNKIFGQHNISAKYIPGF